MRRQVAVIGGGLAGLSAAIALAEAGFSVLLAAPEMPADGRTTALFGRSVEFLQRYGLEQSALQKSAPLAILRIIDDTGRLLRAPSVEFRAAEIGLPAFGINIRNSDLNVILTGVIRRNPAIEWIASPMQALEIHDTHCTVRLENGVTAEVELVVGADGRNSPVRAAAGLEFERWSYPQTALVLNFAHERPHGGISTEFHREAGPFTQVPLPGDHSSLVWVERPDQAAHFRALPPEHLAAMVEARLHSILGKVRIDGAVQSFPLSGGKATRLAGQRVALVGEAAHVFPPIGAQGLNLGLRDAEDLALEAAQHRDALGSRTMLEAYERRRRGDIALRTIGVDLLNRSLLTEMLPAQFARSAGLGLLAKIGPLRRFAMHEGVKPGAGLRALLNMETYAPDRVKGTS